MTPAPSRAPSPNPLDNSKKRVVAKDRGYLGTLGCAYLSPLMTEPNSHCDNSKKLVAITARPGREVRA
jgi:hypothetical protein